MNPTSDSCWLNMSRLGGVSDRHDIVVKLWGNVGLEARDVERSRVDLIAGGNDVAHAENHRAPFEPSWRKMTPLDPLANGRSMDTQSVCDIPDRSLTIATGAEAPAVVVDVEAIQNHRLRSRLPARLRRIRQWSRLSGLLDHELLGGYFRMVRCALGNRVQLSEFANKRVGNCAEMGGYVLTTRAKFIKYPVHRHLKFRSQLMNTHIAPSPRPTTWQCHIRCKLPRAGGISEKWKNPVNTGFHDGL